MYEAQMVSLYMPPQAGSSSVSKGQSVTGLRSIAQAERTDSFWKDDRKSPHDLLGMVVFLIGKWLKHRVNPFGWVTAASIWRFKVMRCICQVRQSSVVDASLESLAGKRIDGRRVRSSMSEVREWSREVEQNCDCPRCDITVPRYTARQQSQKTRRGGF